MNQKSFLRCCSPCFFEGESLLGVWLASKPQGSIYLYLPISEIKSMYNWLLTRVLGLISGPHARMANTIPTDLSL